MMVRLGLQNSKIDHKNGLTHFASNRLYQNSLHMSGDLWLSVLLQLLLNEIRELILTEPGSGERLPSTLQSYRYNVDFHTGTGTPDPYSILLMGEEAKFISLLVARTATAPCGWYRKETIGVTAWFMHSGTQGRNKMC